MSRLLLALALAASLCVPMGGAALLATGETDPVPSEWDKDEIIAVYNELVALEETATPASKNHPAEARRLAREARAWADRFEAEPEWEEFALATSGMASVLARVFADPPSVPERDWDAAAARLDAAGLALPPERQPADS